MSLEAGKVEHDPLSATIYGVTRDKNFYCGTKATSFSTHSIVFINAKIRKLPFLNSKSLKTLEPLAQVVSWSPVFILQFFLIVDSCKSSNGRRSWNGRGWIVKEWNGRGWKESD